MMILGNRDLQKYHLAESEWEILNNYILILQVPHAFQQKLSHEKVPALYQALPHFHRMIAAWERQKELMPHYRNIINMGIEKLTDYVEEIEEIPAYTLAIPVISPTIKLLWHQKYKNELVDWAKQLLINSIIAAALFKPKLTLT
ncbi:hypothetical protein EST38_g13150 [Candolleomyces aberdarensis]|uniref:Uncharacterized protein n=1 Tax=Candolleomyces aberdarensis TaxID=2316362 RepID=A0A4Q2D3G0_9AGAR|nr:hypothetical protein EST38_g13150 [Candolleomyces aberdarensis]